MSTYDAYDSGFSRDISRDGKWRAGDVIRRNTLSVAHAIGAAVQHMPFADAVILGFNVEGVVRISRPYVYASGVGTTGPTPLLGCETYDLPEAMLNDKHFQTDVPLWSKVDAARIL